VNLDRAFTHPPTFTTERLRVRPIELTDARALFEIKSDRTVTERYGQKPNSWEETQAWVRDRLADRSRRGSIYWVFTLRDDDTAVGSCCYWNFEPGFRTAEIGYELHRAHWGTGIMTEALPPIIAYGFASLGLHRIEACPLAENTPSRKLPLKLGFKYEGKLRQRVFFKGRYLDQLYYGLLKKDWQVNLNP
jgi:ribosomal-protein-alanine N-acetyltransferase